MTKAYKLLSILLVFLFAVPNFSNAQILVGDTLEMTKLMGIINDTTFKFELNARSKDIRPMSIGLVLSGGGAKGLAHIGVLKVLEREGIPIDYIGGTSMGGLVGGLYAVGYTPDQLDIISHDLPWAKLLSDEKERRDLSLQEKFDFDRYLLSLPMTGFIPGLPKGLKEGQLVINVLNKLTWSANDITDFSQLPTPFFCVATDLETGDTVLIESGDLPKSLRATMSIPSIFNPIEINGKTVIDGGIVNNFPVDVMLAKGLDYVIGVDVGAPLYKDNEISSVLEILDQISSFHQQERYHTNVILTDLYIKPDITGLTAMSFDDVTDVITRGEVAAMQHIDEIRALAAEIKKQRTTTKRIVNLRTTDTIYISEMVVEGLRNVSIKLVEGRLGIHLPGVNSVSNINAAIDRLYSSNYFEFINYKLIKKEDGYILSILVEEKTSSMFHMGAFYNTDQGAALLINVQLINKMIAGSSLDFSLKVGTNPAGGIRYLVDRGRNLGFGVNVHYNSSYLNFYNSDFSNVEGKYSMSFTTLDVFLISNLTNNVGLAFGGTMEYLNIVTEISPIPISYHGDPYFNLFFDYTVDSYDNKYFPTKGSHFQFSPKVVTQYNEKGVFYINTEASTVINLNKNFSLLPSAFLGVSWNGLKNTGYFYALGGAGINTFKNFKPFVGLPLTGSIANNLLYARMDLRYQFFKKHFLFLKANAAVESNLFEELITKSDEFTFGGGIGYSLNSLVGPIDLSVNISNRAYEASFFLNIGFFF